MSMDNHIERLINHVEKTIEVKEYAFLSLGKSNIKAKVKLLKKPNYLRSCLLYTSPSPRDLSTSRMPSSA